MSVNNATLLGVVVNGKRSYSTTYDAVRWRKHRLKEKERREQARRQVDRLVQVVRRKYVNGPTYGTEFLDEMLNTPFKIRGTAIEAITEVFTVVGYRCPHRFPRSKSTTKSLTLKPSDEEFRGWQIHHRLDVGVGGSGYLPLFEIRRSNLLNAGYGLFALVAFRAGQRIGIYHGELTSPERASKYAIQADFGVVDPMGGGRFRSTRLFWYALL